MKCERSTKKTKSDDAVCSSAASAALLVYGRDSNGDALDFGGGEGVHSRQAAVMRLGSIVSTVDRLGGCHFEINPWSGQCWQCHPVSDGL
ncbi:hypothetical protein AB1N83_003769 [Pleurotus pulmonarius]